MTDCITSADFRARYGDTAPSITPAKARRPSRTVQGPYHTRCRTCLEEFTTMASQSRHQAPGHATFECVL